MKYGAVFPQLESGTDPSAIRDYVQAVEGMGFDYLLAYDHVLGANPDRPGGWHGPYTYTESFQEVFVTFAWLAGLTQTLQFTTGILILPQRQTVLVAKQAAQLDLLSNGRLRLGVGIGWNKVEYDSLNEDFTNRGKRSEEQVRLLRELWTKELVTFNGEYHTIEDAGINPLPVQRPIPIWFGGGADAVLKRMANIGDGWMPNAMPLEQARESVNRLKGYLNEAGRNPADFGMDVRLNYARQPRSEWSGYLSAWREMGATHFGMNTMGMGYATLDDHLKGLAEFKDEMDF